MTVETEPAADMTCDLENSIKGIDREALKRLNVEIEARQRAEAERAASAEKCTAIKRAKPEATSVALSIREFLNSTPIKSGNARILALCQKHGIDIDKNPWPPRFPEQNEPEPDFPKTKQEKQLILFPEWADNRRATAQAVFRSALFPALNFKEGRPFLKQKQIASVKGVTVFFTGEQFDQSDLDVYLELLQIARETPLGMECSFTAYGLLKALGRTKGNKDHKRLHSELIRLCAGTVDMTDHNVRYFGHLVEGGIKDEITRHYRIRINPDFAHFFKIGLWASLDIEQRRALGRNQTAKALHAYYSTHAVPGPHSYERLATLVGLNNKTCRNLRASLIKAHDKLKRIGFLTEYEAKSDTIKAAINPTPSQARHVARKIIKTH